MLQRSLVGQRKRTLRGGYSWDGAAQGTTSQAQAAGVTRPLALYDTDNEEEKDEQAHEPLELERLLFRDVARAPLLEKAEERALTHKARAAWQGLLTCLKEQSADVFSPPDTPEKAVNFDSFSERDVLQVLSRLQERLEKQACGEGGEPSSEELWAFLHTGQEKLACFRRYRDELVRRNLRLVASVARHQQSHKLGYLDLVQEGTFGLMRAIEKFDPAKEVRFGTYAIWWIWQAMSWAQDHHSEEVVRVPASFQAQQRRLGRLSQAREEKAGSLAGPEKPLGIRMLSLDAPLGDGDERRLEEFLPHPQTLSPEEEVLKEDRETQLLRALACLAPQEADILRLRFGLEGGQAFTLKEVGERLGVSRERVRQMEGRACSRLRRICQENGLRLGL